MYQSRGTREFMKGASEYLSGVAWMNVMHCSCLGRGIGKC